MEFRGEVRGVARWDKIADELNWAVWGKRRSVIEERGCPGKGGISTTTAHQMEQGDRMMEDLQLRRAFRSRVLSLLSERSCLPPLAMIANASEAMNASYLWRISAFWRLRVSCSARSWGESSDRILLLTCAFGDTLPQSTYADHLQPIQPSVKDSS